MNYQDLIAYRGLALEARPQDILFRSELARG